MFSREETTILDLEVLSPLSIAKTLKLYSVSSIVTNFSLSTLKLTFVKGGIDSMEVLWLSISVVMLLTVDEGVRLSRSVLFAE